jgi:glycosidase
MARSLPSRPGNPSWVRDSVFYQIFPDRFASSRKVPKPGKLEPWDSPPTRSGFKGGDLLGIVEHPDHIERLGANAIYLNPIFASASNHRYHTFDYERVDPLLGRAGVIAFLRRTEEEVLLVALNVSELPARALIPLPPDADPGRRPRELWARVRPGIEVRPGKGGAADLRIDLPPRSGSVLDLDPR